jgi:hypothetical protein
MGDPNTHPFVVLRINVLLSANVCLGDTAEQSSFGCQQRKDGKYVTISNINFNLHVVG